MTTRSVSLMTFAGQRRAALTWGIALGLFLVFSMWTNWRHEYPTDEARLRLAQQVESGGLAFGQVLFGQARQVAQFSGHLEWRGLGLHPVLLGLYMVIAATGVSRGAEARGELDLTVATHSRRRTFVGIAGGLALALTVACALNWLALLASGPVSGEPVPDPALAAVSLANVWLAAMLWGALALLVAQFTASPHTAAMATGGGLLASYLVANLGLAAKSLANWRAVSPLYPYSLSAPLTTGQVSWWALGSTAAGTLACLIVAGWVFSRRDLGAAVSLGIRQHRQPRRQRGRRRSGTWLLRNAMQRVLRGELNRSMAWGAGLSLYAVLVIVATPSIAASFAELPETVDAVRELNFELASDSGIISSVLFLTLPLLVGLCAVTATSRWAGQEAGGANELELSSPVSRQRYFLHRAAGTLLAIALVVAVVAVSFLAGAGFAGLKLGWRHATAAVLLLMLPAAVIIAFGYLVAAVRPHATIGVLAAATAASFVFTLFAPAFDLPEAARKLSVFELYGRPILQGVHWEDVGIMLTLVAAFLGVGVTAFSRRDLLK